MKCYKIRRIGTVDGWARTNRSDIWQTQNGAKTALHNVRDNRWDSKKEEFEIVEFDMSMSYIPKVS